MIYPASSVRLTGTKAWLRMSCARAVGPVKLTPRASASRTAKKIITSTAFLTRSDHESCISAARTIRIPRRMADSLVGARSSSGGEVLVSEDHMPRNEVLPSEHQPDLPSSCHQTGGEELMPKPDDVGVGVAICILDEKHNMLMLRRSKNSPHGAGMLSWPGGWIDRTDETLLDAIGRELAEEVGLKLETATLVSATSVDFPEIETRCITMLFVAFAEEWSGKLVNKEPDKVDELFWHPLFTKSPEPLFGALDKGGLFEIRAGVRTLLEK